MMGKHDTPVEKAIELTIALMETGEKLGGAGPSGSPSRHLYRGAREDGPHHRWLQETDRLDSAGEL